MHDAVAAVAGLAAERELAARIPVECHADFAQPCDAARRCLGHDLRHVGRREIRGHAKRVGRVQGRGIARADRRGDATLGEP